MDSLQLDVRWASRTVRVHVTVEAGIGPANVRPLDVRVHTIDADDVASRDAALTFLKEITRHEADGVVVEALAFERHAGLLLDALGVLGPPPDPIVVDLEV